jgi:hypothetical protein
MTGTPLFDSKLHKLRECFAAKERSVFKGTLHRLQYFCIWLFSRESLQDSDIKVQKEASAALNFLAWLLHREQLPAPAPQTRPHEPTRSWLSSAKVLIQQEPLDTFPETVRPPGNSMLHFLFMPDVLEDSPQSSGPEISKGFVRWLMSAESLSDDSENLEETEK